MACGGFTPSPTLPPWGGGLGRGVIPALPILCALVALAVACTPATSERNASGATTSVPQPTGEVTVFAAASLVDAFNEIAGRFQAANPQLTAALNYGASTQLATQLEQGAGADVFASADQAQMERARAAGRIDGPDIPFAANRLVIIAPATNPSAMRGPADLRRPGLKVVATPPEVPIGAYTQTTLEKMSQDPRFGVDFKERVNANVVSREPNVRQLVAKVQLGEADAAIAYRSDVTPQLVGQLLSFDIPDAHNVVASYPLALVQGAANRAAGAAFIGFVLSAEGQSILARWNFTPVTAIAAPTG